MKNLRDKTFMRYRNERNRQRFSCKRLEFIKIQEEEEEKLENYLTMEDILSGKVETKLLAKRASLIRDSIKSKNLRGILDQVSKLNCYLCKEAKIKEERLSKFCKTGLIQDYIQLIELSFVKNRHEYWVNVEGIEKMKKEFSEEYKLMKLLVWSLSNICAGDEHQIDEVFENGYFDIIVPMLSIKCEKILADVMTTIGNIIGCNYKKYRGLMNEAGLLKKFENFFEENLRILTNKRVVHDIAWIFSNYCMELKNVSKDVRIFFLKKKLDGGCA